MAKDRTYIEVTAFHEAGHVVAALAEGGRVAAVGVSRRRPGSGLTHMVTQTHKNPFNCERGAYRSAWHYTLQSQLKSVRPLLAGPLAEAKLVGTPLRSLGSVSDFERCLQRVESLQSHYNLLKDLGGNLPAFCPYEIVNKERMRVRRWVAQPKVWVCIERLAQALIRQQYLDEEEILWVCSGASTSLALRAQESIFVDDWAELERSSFAALSAAIVAFQAQYG